MCDAEKSGSPVFLTLIFPLKQDAAVYSRALNRLSLQCRKGPSLPSELQVPCVSGLNFAYLNILNFDHQISHDHQAFLRLWKIRDMLE